MIWKPLQLPFVPPTLDLPGCRCVCDCSCSNFWNHIGAHFALGRGFSEGERFDPANPPANG